MSTPNDLDPSLDSLPTSPRSLSTDEAYAFYGLTARQWKLIKRSVIRGSKRFWEKRGLPEPEFSFHSQTTADIATANARKWARLAAAEADATEPDEPSTL